MQGNLLPSRRKTGCRIPLLESGAGVVPAVRIVPVADETAGDLELVRGIVVVVPGCRRLPESDLEHERGHEQRQCDEDGERRKQLGTPRAHAPARGCEERDDEAGDNSGRADEAEIPLPPRRAHGVTEQSVRVDRRRMEGPRIGAELRHDDRDERAERREDRPGACAPDPHLAGTASRGSVAVRGAGAGRGVGTARYAAAIPSTSHVIGSSKKPLYASEWTNRAKKTAASDKPKAWWRRWTALSARAAPARIAT